MTKEGKAWLSPVWTVSESAKLSSAFSNPFTSSQGKGEWEQLLQAQDSIPGSQDCNIEGKDLRSISQDQLHLGGMVMHTLACLNPIRHVGSCQLDHIWNQLKPKQLDGPMRKTLDWIIWGWPTYPKSGPHLLVADHLKGQRKYLPFACWLSPLLAS